MFARKFLRLDTVGKNHRDLDDGDAFIPVFRHGFVPVSDGDAEAFGEEFILAITSAEAVGETARDELLDEDLGGLTIEIEAPFDDADDLGTFDRKPT